MRNSFDKQLNLLSDELIYMGALCEKAIAISAKALLDGDKVAAATVIEHDEDINTMERNIEALCLKLLLQQQPVARDLRQISAALKMITDLERIGDHAADIAEIIGYLDGKTGADCKYIADMARATIKMVTESIEAYVKRDLQLAQAVISHDDVVDELFEKVKCSLIKMIGAHPEEGEYALDLLMVAKYFERIGDHATNLAEWVEFAVTGVHRSGQ